MDENNKTSEQTPDSLKDNGEGILSPIEYTSPSSSEVQKSPPPWDEIHQVYFDGFGEGSNEVPEPSVAQIATLAVMYTEGDVRVVYNQLLTRWQQLLSHPQRGQRAKHLIDVLDNSFDEVKALLKGNKPNNQDIFRALVFAEEDVQEAIEEAIIRELNRRSGEGTKTTGKRTDLEKYKNL